MLIAICITFNSKRQFSCVWMGDSFKFLTNATNVHKVVEEGNVFYCYISSK